MISGIRGPGSGVRCPGFGISGPGFGIVDPGPRALDPGHGVRDPASRISDPGSGNLRSGSRGSNDKLTTSGCITKSGPLVLDHQWVYYKMFTSWFYYKLSAYYNGLYGTNIYSTKILLAYLN